MRLAVLSGLFAAALIGATSAFAQDQKFTSPKGYSFTYPAGWFVVNKETRGKMPERLREWMDNSPNLLAQVDVMLAPETITTSGATVNIAVKEGAMPINETTRAKMAEMLPKTVPGILTSSARLGNVGRTPALIFDYEQNPAAPFPMKSMPQPKLPWAPASAIIFKGRQIYLRSGSQTLFITYGAVKEEFDRNLPAFDSMLASLQVMPTNDLRDALNRVRLPAAAYNALLYFAIGSAMAIAGHFLLKQVKKKKKRKRKMSQPQAVSDEPRQKAPRSRSRSEFQPRQRPKTQ